MASFSFPLSLLVVVVVILLADVTNSVVGAKRYVTRTASAGPVEGCTETVLGRDVNSFLGIPFAEPPIGDLRFKAPKPYHKWTHVLNATTLPASCFQAIDTNFDRFSGVEMWNPNTPLSEDCLYLNIWEPVSPDSSSSSSKKKAVMVWIYGGGLMSGTSTLTIYDGATLAVKGDVVVVSMQYRLGALGFLYLGTPDAPGNQGLLDQNLALRWIRENIASFGGDPDRVTLFGESAGALSVGLHLISPLSKDLVRSGIMQSASAVGSWGFDAPEHAKAKAKLLAKQLNCAKKNELDAVRCLRQVHATEIIATQNNVVVGEGKFMEFAFVSTIDNHFITENPTDSLKRGNFKQDSVLLGFNRDEGYFFLAYEYTEHLGRQITKDITVSQYKSMVRDVLGYPSAALAETVAFEYGAPYHGKTSTQFRKPLDDVVGDVMFKCPVIDAAMAYADDPKVSVYVYEFNHRTSASPWPSWMGVMHGFEIDHVFGAPIRDGNYTKQEMELSRKMIDYWTNFAKTG